MLDISFSELTLIGGVALVVLGPEKLAVLARTTGKWAGKAQRYVNEVKQDLAREGELTELRQLKTDLEAAGRTFINASESLHHDLHSATQDLYTWNNPSTAIATMPEATELPAAYHATQYQAALMPQTPNLNFNLSASNLETAQSDLLALQMDIAHLEQRLAHLKAALATTHAPPRP